jgi:hypothetical protein
LAGLLHEFLRERGKKVSESCIDLIKVLALWREQEVTYLFVFFINGFGNISSLNSPHHFSNFHATNTNILLEQLG